MKFQLNQRDYERIQSECIQYKNKRAAVVESLKIVQESYGWVSDDAILVISKILNLSITDVEGVATFYNQIFRQPVGKNIIRYCDSVVCYVLNYIDVKKTIENFLNIKTGETTKDGNFTLLPTCCLGVCDRAPAIMINNRTYIRVTTNNIIQFLENYT